MIFQKESFYNSTADAAACFLSNGIRYNVVGDVHRLVRGVQSLFTGRHQWLLRMLRVVGGQTFLMADASHGRLPLCLLVWESFCGTPQFCLIRIFWDPIFLFWWFSFVDQKLNNNNTCLSSAASLTAVSSEVVVVVMREKIFFLFLLFVSSGDCGGHPCRSECHVLNHNNCH